MGHRGFAREVAALLDLPFKQESLFLAEKAVVSYDSHAHATDAHPFAMRIEHLKHASVLQVCL